MTRYLVLFVAILLGLFIAERTVFVQDALVLPWTAGLASLSAGILTLLDGQVRAVGNVLQSTHNGFAVSIEAGCNGIEAALVLVAAIAAFPAPLRDRLRGVVLGLLAIQLINVLRVISLFYLGQWHRPLFDWAHLYLWQAMIMFDVLLIWLVWMRSLSAKPIGRKGRAAI